MSIGEGAVRLLVLTFLLITAAEGFAQKLDHQVDLGATLGRLGYDSSEFSGVSTTSRHPEAEWARGYHGEIEKKAISRSPQKRGKSEIQSGVRIVFKGNAVSEMHACTRSLDEGCAADQTKKISFEVSGTRIKFTHDKTSWKLDLYGKPCPFGQQCSVVFPSWTLEDATECCS